MALVLEFPSQNYRITIGAADQELRNARKAFKDIFFSYESDSPVYIAAENRVRDSHNLVLLARDLYFDSLPNWGVRP